MLTYMWPGPFDGVSCAYEETCDSEREKSCLIPVLEEEDAHACVGAWAVGVDESCNVRGLWGGSARAR